MKAFSIFFVLVFLIISNIVAYADDMYDSVYLKDSTIIKGKIIETIPNKSITIKSFDGKIQKYDYDKILQIKKEKISDIDLYKISYPEIGINVGTPGGLNLAAGYWPGPIGIRVSGMYLGKIYGIQLNLGSKISDSPSFCHSIGLAGGVSYIGTKNKSWEYVGLVYNLNWGGFFLETGLSIGKGDYNNPQLLFQIGYMYREIKFDLTAQDNELDKDYDKETSIEIDSLPIERAYNLVYMDGGIGYLIFWFGFDISINYEREILKYFGLRVGYGKSGGTLFSPKSRKGYIVKSVSGYLLMLNFHTRGDHKFNIGAGVNYLNENDNSWQYRLAGNISYRYQPLSGGLFLSAGINFIFAVPVINWSVGYAF